MRRTLTDVLIDRGPGHGASPSALTGSRTGFRVLRRSVQPALRVLPSRPVAQFDLPDGAFEASVLHIPTASAPRGRDEGENRRCGSGGPPC